MKLVGLAMVRNESDIIESFVRVNLRVLDELHVVDDGSTDGTVSILDALIDEGLPVSRYAFQRYGQDFQQQARVMTVLLAQLDERPWDFAVLLDADEFILASRPEFEQDLAATARDHFGVMQWLTYVPIDEGYFASSDPIHELFRARAMEQGVYYKLVVPRALAPGVAVSPGNHWAANREPYPDTHRLCRTRLAHVPVRSAGQIIAKSLVGSHVLALKANRQPGEGFHWDLNARLVRERGYRLTLAEVQDLAYGYAENDRQNLVRQWQAEPRIPASGPLRYLREPVMPALQLLDHLLIELAERRAVRAAGATDIALRLVRGGGSR